MHREREAPADRDSEKYAASGVSTSTRRYSSRMELATASVAIESNIPSGLHFSNSSCMCRSYAEITASDTDSVRHRQPTLHELCSSVQHALTARQKATVLRCGTFPIALLYKALPLCWLP